MPPGNGHVQLRELQLRDLPRPPPPGDAARRSTTSIRPATTSSATRSPRWSGWPCYSARRGRSPSTSATTSATCTTSRHLAEAGLVDFPLHVQFVLGVLGANAATLDQLVHMHRTAHRPVRRPLHVVGGRRRLPGRVPARGRLADPWAGHVRVGLEDNLRVERDPARGVERRAGGEGLDARAAARSRARRRRRRP